MAIETVIETPIVSHPGEKYIQFLSHCEPNDEQEKVHYRQRPAHSHTENQTEISPGNIPAQSFPLLQRDTGHIDPSDSRKHRGDQRHQSLEIKGKVNFSPKRLTLALLSVFCSVIGELNLLHASKPELKLICMSIQIHISSSSINDCVFFLFCLLCSQTNVITTALTSDSS